PAAEPRVRGGDRQCVLGRDPVRGAVAAITAAGVGETGRGGGAVSRDSTRAIPSGGGDSGQPQLRGVEAGPLVHGRAHERWKDLPAVRAPDQPAGFEPRAAELLPGLPALNDSVRFARNRPFESRERSLLRKRHVIPPVRRGVRPGSPRRSPAGVAKRPRSRRPPSRTPPRGGSTAFQT